MTTEAPELQIDKLVLPRNFTLETINSEDSQLVFDTLEEPSWAPWLRYSASHIRGQAETFPEGQLLISDEKGMPAASLSTNRIEWDGSIESLPTWDGVAGDPPDFRRTYKSNGNTLCLMSMSVLPELRGLKLSTYLALGTIDIARDLGIGKVIGPFRPSGYGKHKSEIWHKSHAIPDFSTYCKTVDINGNPVDPWLRALKRMGMQTLKPEHHAMVVEASIEEFERFKKEYNPDNWYQVDDTHWESGETGTWETKPHEGIATYTESNLWGVLHDFT